MTFSTFKNIKLAGISTVVPRKEIDLRDDKLLYDGDERRIKRVINSSGFLKRRVSEIDVTTSDLCLFAAIDLLKNLNINHEDIDALIFLSYTPDFLMPATSYVLHKKLRLSQNCIVMDIPQACSGYEIGLFQASMLINAGCKKVLMLVGDTFSKFSDMFNNHTAPVFGDAGSASLIEFDDAAAPVYFNIHSDGNGYDALICKKGGFRNAPKSSDFYDDGSYKYDAKMDGGRIFDFTSNFIAPSIEDILIQSGIKHENVDYFVLHQANKLILQDITRKLHVDSSKVPLTTLSKYGNQCGASVPCTISDTLKEEISHKKLKLLLSGFGAGLSWANAIIETNNIYCSGILEYGVENK